jgi:hypothetical protein
MALIDTIQGKIDETRLERREETVDNDNEHTVVTEYWLDDVMVRRDVHVTLKKSPSLYAEIEGF